jgi:hypothetical protein
MLNQILTGAFSAACLLFAAGLCWAFYVFGKRLVDPQSIRGLPRWQAALVVLAVSALLGLIAAVPSADADNPVFLFSFGEMTDVAEDAAPYHAFTLIFLLTAIPAWLGVWKQRNR